MQTLWTKKASHPLGLIPEPLDIVQNNDYLSHTQRAEAKHRSPLTTLFRLATTWVKTRTQAVLYI